MPAPASLPTLMQTLGLHIDYAPPLVLGVPKIATPLTSKLSTYRHSILAVGGYWDAAITLDANDMMIEDWYEYGLGRHIETLDQDQQPVWEGFVNKIGITYGGLQATVGPLFDVVNKNKVVFTTIRYNTNPPVGGQTDETLWAEDLFSQQRYGILEAIMNGGSLLEADADFIRDLYLAENKAARASSDITLGGGGPGSISLEILGYVHWMDHYYYTTSTYVTGTQTASAKLTAAIAADPNGFISTGTARIGTNILAVPQIEKDNRTTWAIVKDILAKGDGADNRWLFGIYANRLPWYYQIPDAIEYVQKLRDPGQRLETPGGGVVRPWRALPGKWLFRSDFLVGRTPTPGVDLRRDPRVQFVESVEYTAPIGLALKGGKTDRLPQKLARLGLGGMG